MIKIYAYFLNIFSAPFFSSKGDFAISSGVVKLSEVFSLRSILIELYADET